jgi:hypothetical protein
MSLRLAASYLVSRIFLNLSAASSMATVLRTWSNSLQKLHHWTLNVVPRHYVSEKMDFDV